MKIIQETSITVRENKNLEQIFAVFFHFFPLKVFPNNNQKLFSIGNFVYWKLFEWRK